MTIFGWDTSHFDAPSIGSALAEGISFITHKAGGDSRSGDPELAPWWSGVRGLDPARVLLGTYWVPRPDLNPNPAGEADRWVGTLDARCPGWRNRPHMLQMDAERWPGGDKTKPGKAYLQALGDRLVALMPKLRPVCYASKGQYGDELRGLTFPLWNARYPTDAQAGFRTLYSRVGGDDGPGWSRYSGQMPAIWQYTSSATIGGQTTCDANAYRGSLAELTALVAPGWETDMPTADEIANAVWAKADTATIRNGRTVGGTLDALAVNSIATVSALKTLAGKDTVDEQALAAALAPAVAGLVLAGLPADTPVTTEQLQAAIVAALRELAAPAA